MCFGCREGTGDRRRFLLLATDNKLLSLLTFQRAAIAARAALEQERENAERDRVVLETQARLNELHFNFTFD